MGTRWTRNPSRTPVLSHSGHRHRWSPVVVVVVGMVVALLPALPAGATTSSGTSSAPAQRAPGTAPSALAPDHVASTGAGLGLSAVLGAGTKTTSLGGSGSKTQSLAAPAGHGSPSLLGPRGASTHQATSPTSGAVTTSAVTTSAVSTPSSSGGPQFGSPDWSNVANPNPVPPSRELAGAALDSSHNRDFIFGGLGIGSAFLGDTWAFNGTTWSQANPSSSPSARDGVQMAYDQATSTTYLFGGYNGSTYLGDTWAFNGTTWTQLAPATSPAPRGAGVMAYDAALGKVVMFGGGNSTATLGDTWAFDGTNWTQLSTTGPSARIIPGMAYDSSVGGGSSGDLVLYGGEDATNTVLGDTWLYTASGWVQASPAHFPGLRAGEGMAFDSVLDRIVFYGGSDSTYTYEDVWMWDGADWAAAASTIVVPTYRRSMVMVPAAGHGQLLFFGGYFNGGVGNDTDLYDWANTGGAPGATIESHATSTKESFGTNVSNGNLVDSAKDLSVHGVGVNFSLDRVYNSQIPGGTASGVGNGWDFTTGRDLFLSPLPDGSFILAGYGGTAGQLYFHNNGSGFTSPPGVKATLVKLGSGQYTLTVNATGEVYTFGNAVSASLLVSDADRNGNAITFAYNSSAQLTAITDTQGRQYTLAYNGAYLHTITDPTGRVVTYTQNSAGYLTQVAYPDGTSVTYNYGPVPTNELTSIQNERGNTWSFGYDSYFHATSVTYPPAASGGATSSTNYSYGPTDPSVVNAWVKTTSTDPNGHATTYQSAYTGTALKATDALGRSRASTYSADKDVLTAADAMSSPNTTTFTYDSLNNPASQALPTGATGYLAYANGQAMGGQSCASSDSGHPYLAKCAMDAQSNMSTFSYDGPGNLTTATNAKAGLQQTNIYNPSTPTCGGKPGELCSTTNGNRNVTSYTYDSAGNLAKVTPPAPLGSTTIAVDSLGRPVSVTDGKGQVTRTTYNADDQVTQVLTGGATSCSYAAGTCVTSTYNADGNLATQTDQTGLTTYTYDNLDRQINKRLSSGANLAQSYDSVGNVASYTDSGGTVSYGFDAANELTSLTEPSGARTAFGYNNDAVRTSTTYPGGTVLANTPDNSMRTQEIKSTNGSNTFSDFTYTYANGSGDTSLNQSRTDKVAGATTNYAYDALNRLTQATETTGGNTTASWLYCYDNDGNRTGSSTTAGASCSAPSTTYQYNGADQLTGANGNVNGWSYDANGNETAGVGSPPRINETYSASDQLTGLTTTYQILGLTLNNSPTSFAYAGLTNTERTASGATTYQNGPEGLANQTASNAATSFTRDPSGTLISERVGGQSYYYLFDRLGSVVGLVNASGAKVNSYSYDPYGGARSVTEQVANPNRYAGGYLDAYSGLYHFGARYYDSSLGRWSQLDPSGQSVGYAYAGDDPINLVDLSGQNAFSDFFTKSVPRFFKKHEGDIRTAAFFITTCVAGAATALPIGIAAGPIGEAVAAGAGCVGSNAVRVAINQLLSQSGMAPPQ